MTVAALSATDLTAVLEAYNEVAERLKQSHELLRLEVCRLHEQLEEKNKELARHERLASLGQMAAGVAHEIRNPLGGVGLYASLLERDLKDQPDELRIVRHLMKGVRSMESVVGDILAFAGDGDPRPQICRLEDVVGEVVDQVAPQAQANQATIQVSISDDERALYCDPSQINRALMNLILNALDAAGPKGEVMVSAECGKHDTDMATIEVADDGPGIPNELRHRVFDPFFTTKDSGTGLGLAIVHRMAESNGGTVSLSQRTGGGASFALRVPLAPRTCSNEI